MTPKFLRGEWNEVFTTKDTKEFCGQPSPSLSWL